ncbi:high-affinity iron permease, partial [Blyttiomyces sp. JEL0837]
MTFIHNAFPTEPALQTKLRRQVYLGTFLGILVTLSIGTVFLVLFFKYANNIWNKAEEIWEGSLSLLASILLTIMGIAFMKMESITLKWKRKLNKALERTEEFGDIIRAQKAAGNGGGGGDVVVDDDVCSEASKKSFFDDLVGRVKVAYRKRFRKGEETSGKKKEAKKKSGGGGMAAMLVLPLITVLREGLEGMVFLGGIGLSADPGTIPLAAILGLICGLTLGYIIYKTGNTIKLQIFFISASIFLFYLSSGLAVLTVHHIESYMWSQHVPTNDPDQANTRNQLTTLWQLDCCNSKEGAWQLFSAIFGYYQVGTYASVSVYVGYWLFIAVVFVVMKIVEKRRRREDKLRRHMKKEDAEFADAKRRLEKGKERAQVHVDVD